MQAKVGGLPQALSPSSPSTPANEMKSSLCPSSPLTDACLAHSARSRTNSDCIADAIKSLETLSMINTHMQCFANCSKIQQAEQDTWLLIGFEDFGGSDLSGSLYGVLRSLCRHNRLNSVCAGFPTSDDSLLHCNNLSLFANFDHGESSYCCSLTFSKLL